MRNQARAKPEEDCSDLESGAPLVLEDVKADAAELVDVGVVDLGEESHFRRFEWVAGGQEKLETETAAFIRGGRGPKDDNVEVSEILLRRRCANSWRCDFR